jgi:hypothetical protein
MHPVVQLLEGEVHSPGRMSAKDVTLLSHVDERKRTFHT